MGSHSTFSSALLRITEGSLLQYHTRLGTPGYCPANDATQWRSSAVSREGQGQCSMLLWHAASHLHRHIGRDTSASLQKPGMREPGAPLRSLSASSFQQEGVLEEIWRGKSQAPRQAPRKTDAAVPPEPTIPLRSPQPWPKGSSPPLLAPARSTAGGTSLQVGSKGHTSPCSLPHTALPRIRNGIQWGSQCFSPRILQQGARTLLRALF